MRVIVDTNVLFSGLLSRSKINASINRFLEAAIQGAFVLVVAEEVIDELVQVRGKKPYLAEAISADEMDRFISSLRLIADILPRQTDEIPAVLRDPKDDFLLIAAAMGDADFLVTGDRDLLDIRDHLTRPRIVTIAEFLQLLDA